MTSRADGLCGMSLQFSGLLTLLAACMKAESHASAPATPVQRTRPAEKLNADTPRMTK